MVNGEQTSKSEHMGREIDAMCNIMTLEGQRDNRQLRKNTRHLHVHAFISYWRLEDGVAAGDMHLRMTTVTCPGYLRITRRFA